MNCIIWGRRYVSEGVLHGVIRHRFGHLNNKKIFFSKHTTILRGEICPSVNATLGNEADAMFCFRTVQTEKSLPMLIWAVAGVYCRSVTWWLD